MVSPKQSLTKHQKIKLIKLITTITLKREQAEEKRTQTKKNDRIFLPNTNN